ncbi:MAG: hypothetical protein CMQ10_03750 [Gammaproteobacteria bacterium]|nr:hypothetical protein [Gammaproteobacteria bacterium]
MAVLSSVSQGPKFVTDPVLKAAKERQAFMDSQVLANPSFAATDDFISVIGAKALGVALDPETGRMPNVPAAGVPEVAGSAEFLELDSAEPARQAEAERIAALEEQLAAVSSEQTAEIERAKAQAFSEGQAQGQLEAKQVLEMEAESNTAERALELRDMVGALIHEAQNHLVSHQDLFDPLKKLALALAEQIARRELTLSDDSLIGFIEDSLAQVDPMEMGEVIIYVSHDWYERLQQPELEDVFATYALRRDDTLQPGSVRLAVQDTSIVDLIEHRVEQLAEQLLTQLPPAEHSRELSLQKSEQAQHEAPLQTDADLSSADFMPAAEDDGWNSSEFDDQGTTIQGDYSEVDDIFFQRPPDEG